MPAEPAEATARAEATERAETARDRPAEFVPEGAPGASGTTGESGATAVSGDPAVPTTESTDPAERSVPVRDRPDPAADSSSGPPVHDGPDAPEAGAPEPGT
ncbi:hypothetical protein Scani_07200 [Streptomyces caniferus]|uniref:Uncharacterized protein n=1 Tax=Streptomyces caniferus TaxID=285557 RepID=A0A640S1B4_9ACTN|nr:hypothetical protein Scani_07200 [Streptomyces caniferus]